MNQNHKHFGQKTVIEHLKIARQKGSKATSELHGTEPSGFISAAADSAKETVILFLLIWIFCFWYVMPKEVKLWQHLSNTVTSEFYLVETALIYVGFLFTWFLWKVGRSSLLGWSRLERLHRLIEQERWEIQHHRAHEKEELIAMYRQKGLSGDLLDQVIEILMADDNRLLQVMLEEELGLTLESFEHPLKQGFGAGIGVLATSIFGFLGWMLGSLTELGDFVGINISLIFFFSVVTVLSSKYEGNQPVRSLIWHLSTGALTIGSIYLLLDWINS